jgi:signal transduction histidine kinase/ActR/RegA family two-component response regulator
MRPMKLRSHLLLLTLGTLLPIVVFAAIAGWMLLAGLQESALGAAETVWLMGAGVAAAIALALLLATALARKIASPITSLAAATKALVSGASVEPPRAVRIREIAEAAEALGKAASAVRSRETAARDAERAKDDFLAMLSHELRNPLATLASAAYLLRRSAADAASGQAADTVSRQVQHMTRLVEDLLDLSRITKGKLSLSRRPLDLAQVAEQAVGELRAAGRLDKHRITLAVEPAWVRADEARIEQIAANLVGNALKHTPEGGEITVGVRRVHDTVLLCVRDTGVGMAPELAARVFDLFVQGEREHGRGGLGIGLALVKQLAELHGGTAAAASAGPGRGAEFTVSLPAIEAPAEQPAPLPARKPARGGHRILLIEDNDEARRNLCAALSLDGHQVREAADGNAAIRSAAEFSPEVAIIDVGLPGPNGFQVAETLRGASGAPIVLIALTGYTQPDALRRAREAGFDEYLTKPIAPDRLSRLIEATLARRRGRAGTAGQ